MKYVLPAVVGLLLASTVSAFAQAPALRLQLSPGMVLDGKFSNTVRTIAAQSESATSTSSSGGTVAAGADSQKQKDAVLKTLSFDRRPSAILEAWSKPFDPDDDGKDEATKKKEAEAKAKADAEREEAEQAAAAKARTAEQKAAQERAEAEEKMTDEEKVASRKAAKQAAEAKRVAAEKAEEKKKQAAKVAAEIKKFKSDIRLLQRNVTLANWSDVDGFLKSQKPADAKKIYTQLLTSLVSGPPGIPRTRTRVVIGEHNLIRASDVLAVAELCPEEKLSDSMISQLGQLAKLCQKEGQAKSVFLDELKVAVNKNEAAIAAIDAADNKKQPTEDSKDASDADEESNEVNRPRMTRRAAARLLFAADRIEDSRQFLPEIDVAKEDQDVEALAILTDVFLKLHSIEPETQFLEKSWQAAQELLVCEKSDRKQKQKAMRRSVKLVPMLREDLGQQWLNDSFTRQPQKGMEILAGIGAACALSMSQQAQSPDERVGILELQRTAIAALLKEAPEKAEKWSSTLHLLATNWLREATYSRKYDLTAQRGRSMSRDSYGNYFWADSASSSRPPTGMPQPIQSGKVLDVRPGEEWLKHLDAGYRNQFLIETARLHLRVKEEAEAFPYIEQLSKTNAEEATDLVEEFLRVWATNHDPNAEKRRTSSYMFSYGFSQRSNGIPLTRSRQVRNLAELGEYVDRIRQLPLKDIKDIWISAAFTKSHSAAEVYQLADMQKVFGSTEDMEPITLAALLQTMRANLASVWRKPEVQQKSKTNRKQDELQQEVVNGYQAAKDLLSQGLLAHPDCWQLRLVEASIIHDENDYQAEVKHSTGFANNRKAALTAYAKAAECYIAAVPSLKDREFEVDVFQVWFNAALGAPDLQRITQEKLPALAQIPLIREAFQSLPEISRTQHEKMFANSLFTRMSNVNPAVKFRYVKHGLSVVDAELEQAAEAKKVYEYYNDLVSEIKLETVIDGSTKVGHEQPFGLYVNLRHTKAIERESGGFSKYLQNQNSGNGYFYNYGRPTENYRDKFETYARDALDEHFEVLSVTFQPEDVKSRMTAEDSWRTTSYAYVLLKARGPEIDRIAPLKLDLDFMDTTGYVVLPVESQALLINSGATGDARPADKLSLTQTLDERQAKDGKLILEIKAAAQGLVPDLDELVDLKFSGFEVADIEDNGVSVARFDPEHSKPVVVSDRTWSITLNDKDGAATADQEFRFASAKMPVDEEVWQRFDDADLVTVEQSVVLKENYDVQQISSVWIAVGILAVLAVIGVIAWLVLKKPQPRTQVARSKFALPESPTPFNVLSLLKNIERNNGLSPDGKQELATSINRIERYYFSGEQDDNSVDLQEVAQGWVRKAK